jgi:predicted nucleotidyltransferase
MHSENKRVPRSQDDVIKDALLDYCNEVIKRFNPLCIILYGSRAKGTFTNKSDVDIIVISKNFDQDFLSRIRSLIDSNATMLPIEPLGYTEDEFNGMLESCRLTALDAVKEGVAFFGEDYFDRLRIKLNELEKKGIYKGKTSWHVPAEALA